MKNKIKIYLNNVEYETYKEYTIMQAADKLNIKIPRLCYHPDLQIEGSCRICIVEVEGFKNLPASCSTKLREGMKIYTNSIRVRKARKTILELILDNHCEDCNTCKRNQNCELQRLSAELGIRERKYSGQKRYNDIDNSSSFIKRDPQKCILCGKCVKVCSNTQNISAIDFSKRGFETFITTAFNTKIDESLCVACGQCINACPTAALTEKDQTNELFQKLNDPSIIKIAQVAPAVRAAIGEPFGKLGVSCEGEMITALKELGFDYVFDSQFSADLTIMEEASEFIERIKNNKDLPLITSCSPAWIKTVEHFHPEFIKNISTCKSPMSMMASLIKNYFSKLIDKNPENILSVAIMPCTAKKFEAARNELSTNNIADTDIVITTRELAWMIRSSGIDLTDLKKSNFDSPLGISTGAATIFGVTGGVMEAAVRTAYHFLTNEKLEKLEFSELRGFKGIKETTIDINGNEINIAVANGISNAHKLLNIVKNNPKKYHFIEVMSCPGGCIGGGGQPYISKDCSNCNSDILTIRANVLYDLDEKNTIRQSFENPSIKKLYKDFLKEPLSDVSHKLLHTSYFKREPKGVTK